jgi:hypothetical protein
VAEAPSDSRLAPRSQPSGHADADELQRGTDDEAEALDELCPRLLRPHNRDQHELEDVDRRADQKQSDRDPVGS